MKKQETAFEAFFVFFSLGAPVKPPVSRHLLDQAHVAVRLREVENYKTP